MRDYDELTTSWDDMLERLRNKEEPDVETIQRLIFETYHFEKQEIKGDSIPRNRLGLYKLVAQFCESLSENYPEGMTESVSDTWKHLRLACAMSLKTGSIAATEQTHSPSA